MENLDQQNAGQAASVTALRVQLGELLLRERLNQQKDEVDVARRLMLSKLQLLAIEAGESESFHHERRYIQGIKSYVFYLGLQSRTDVNELVNQIEGFSAQGLKASPAAGVAQLHLSAATPAQTKSYASRGASRYVYYGLAVLVAGAVALAISEGWPFKGTQPQTAEQVSSQASSNTETSDAKSESVGATGAASTAVVTANASASSQPATSLTNLSSAQSQAPVQVSQSPSAVQIQPPPREVEPEKNDSASKVPPAAAQNARGMMRIDFKGECWVSLQTTEGKREERIYKQGESLSVPISSVAGLILGNAPAATVYLSGNQVDVLAKGLTTGNVSRLDQKSLQLLQKN